MDLMAVGVPPLAHPVLEAGERHERDRIGRRRSDHPHHDLRINGDERRLRWDRSRNDLHRVAIRARHTTTVALLGTFDSKESL